METLTDQQLLDTVVAVGPQAVLDLFASADQFRMPGETLHPSFVARVFSLRAGQLARSRPLPVVDPDAYERLAVQLIFGVDRHGFMRRLHETALRLRPRGSDSHEVIAARIDTLRALRRDVLPPELVERLGPRNRG